MKKLSLWVIGIFLGVPIIFATIGAVINSNETKLKDQSLIDTLSTDIRSEEIEPLIPQTKWIYQEQEDEMDGGISKWAMIYSNEETNFEFPYNGYQKLKLTVRKTPKYGSDVILSIEKGQFLSNYNNEHIVRIKYGEGKPVVYGYNDPSDGSSNTIFLTKPSSIIQNLKKAEKIILEVEFYDNGTKRFTFDTSGLKW